MNRASKWISLLLAALLVLTGCGGETTQQTTAATQAEETTAVTVPSEATLPEATQASSSGPVMGEVYNKMIENVQMPEMLELDEQMQMDYCGIDSQELIQSLVLVCSDGMRTDEIWLLEAPDEETAQALAELAQQRLDVKGQESVTYSPEQYAVVQEAQILQQGNFLALIVSPEVEALAEVYRQEMGM